MDYARVWRHVADNADKYWRFGAWWYSLKKVLSDQGYDTGTHDDPELRELMDALADHDPERIVELAFDEYARNGMRFDLTGEIDLPDGRTRYLSDLDASLLSSY